MSRGILDSSYLLSSSSFSFILEPSSSLSRICRSKNRACAFSFSLCADSWALKVSYLDFSALTIRRMRSASSYWAFLRRSCFSTSC